jgi:hypothetical protein
MSNISEQKTASQELYLLDVIGKFGNFVWMAGRKIYNLFDRLLRQMGRLLRFFVRKTLWIAASLVVTFVVNEFMDEETSRNYENTMSIKMNLIENAEVLNFVKLLTNVAAGDSAWMRILNLPAYKYAKSINSITPCWGIDFNYDTIVDVIDVSGKYNQPRQWDTLMPPSMIVRNRFYIVSVVSLKSAVPFIQQGLTERIRTDPYLMAQAEVTRKKIAAQISDYKHQIRLLDSLQRQEYFSPKDDARISKMLLKQQGQLLVFQEKDQRLLHTRAIALRDSCLALEARLLLPEMEIIADSACIEKSSIKTYSIWLFILLGIAAAIIWDNRRWLIAQIFSPFRKQE